MTRTRAFLIHLAGSFAIFAVVVALMVGFWFPFPLFGLEKGWEGLRVVALVDIVVGPMLTLIVFKAGKPGLKFDMGVILALQLSALAYGVWNINQARPVALIHGYDHFTPVTRDILMEFDPSGETLARWEGRVPARISVEMPDDPIEFAEAFRLTLEIPGGVHGLVDQYRALEAVWDSVMRDATRITEYVKHDEEWAAELDRFLEKKDRSVESLAFFPYIGREARLFLAFDRQSAEILGVLDIPYDVSLTIPEVPRSDRGS